MFTKMMQSVSLTLYQLNNEHPYSILFLGLPVWDFVDLRIVYSSDKSEPSWLEPELKLKDFQLGSTRDLFPLSSKSKIGRKQAKILILIFF